MRTHTNRICSLLTAAAMLLSLLPQPIFAQTEPQTETTVQTAPSSANIITQWIDETESTLIIDENNQTSYAGLSIQYELNAADTEYNPGDICITIPDISETNSAILPDTSIWDVSCDQTDHTYQFTNTTTIPADTGVTGSIELFWPISQKSTQEITAALSIPQETVHSNELTFICAQPANEVTETPTSTAGQLLATQTLITGHASAQTAPDEEYICRLTLTAQENLQHIIITDILQEIPSDWTGYLQRIDLNACKDLNITGQTYYSTNPDPGNFNDGSWTLEPEGIINAVGIDFGNSVFQNGTTIPIDFYFRATNDHTLVNTHSYNHFCVKAEPARSHCESRIAAKTSTEDIQLVQSFETVLVKVIDQETKQPVPNASVQLTCDNNIIATNASDQNGIVTFEDIPSGITYTVIASSVPSGYQEGATASAFVDTQTTSVTLPIKGQTGALRIKVLDTNGNPVENMAFNLYDDNGQKITELKTNKHGKSSINDLTWGKYVLVETSIPDTYENDMDEHAFQLTQDDPTAHISLIKTIKSTDITLDIKDEQTDTPIVNESYDIYKADGTSLGEFTTDETGTIIIPDASLGSYYITPSITPNRYTIPEAAASFILTDQDILAGNYEIEIHASQPTANLTVQKIIKATDLNTANGLPTFLFELTLPDGTTRHAAVTFTGNEIPDEQGKIIASTTLSNLPTGNYTITELNTSRYSTTSAEGPNQTSQDNTLTFTLGVDTESVRSSRNKIRGTVTYDELNANFSTSIENAGSTEDAKNDMNVDLIKSASPFNTDWETSVQLRISAPLPEIPTAVELVIDINSFLTPAQNPITPTDTTVTFTNDLYEAGGFSHTDLIINNLHHSNTEDVTTTPETDDQTTAEMGEGIRLLQEYLLTLAEALDDKNVFMGVTLVGDNAINYSPMQYLTYDTIVNDFLMSPDWISWCTSHCGSGSNLQAGIKAGIEDLITAPTATDQNKHLVLITNGNTTWWTNNGNPVTNTVNGIPLSGQDSDILTSMGISLEAPDTIINNVISNPVDFISQATNPVMDVTLNQIKDQTYTTREIASAWAYDAAQQVIDNGIQLHTEWITHENEGSSENYRATLMQLLTAMSSSSHQYSWADTIDPSYAIDLATEIYGMSLNTTIPAGSVITDIIGEAVTPEKYNFDLIKENLIILYFSDEGAIAAKLDATGRAVFNHTDGSQSILQYTATGPNGEEYFTLTLGRPLERGSSLGLSYTACLTKRDSSAGTHIVYPNINAWLSVWTQDNGYQSYLFPRPYLDYTYHYGGGGGGGDN